jgi:hypothetical protein
MFKQASGPIRSEGADRDTDPGSSNPQPENRCSTVVLKISQLNQCQVVTLCFNVSHHWPKTVSNETQR